MSNDKVTFEYTIKGTYQVDRAFLEDLYGTDDVYEAAEIDRQNMEDDPSVLGFFLEDGRASYEVKPVDS
jgi:hypothetical protein